MRRTELLLITVGLVFLGIVVVGSRSNAATDESYAVYSAILKGTTKSPHDGQPVKLFVIAETTGGMDDEIADTSNKVLDHAKQSLSRPVKDAISDYQKKNEKEQQLIRSFDLSTKYELIDKTEFNAFFKRDNLEQSWQDFYTKYPKSPGFIVFSNVGFDAEKRHAVVYREIHCGGLCADGSFVFLEHIDSKWKITKAIPIWAS